MFFSGKVQNVFEAYQERHEEDKARMKVLGPEGIKFRDEFLLPIGEDVGRFLHALILAKRPQRILEVGTSYGYSTLFMADAARQIGGQVISLEIADYKQEFAREKMAAAGLETVVDFRLGDAIESIKADSGSFDFALMDIWKELYIPALEALYPKLSEEAIIAADNMYGPPIHIPMARKYRAFVASKPDLKTTLMPIGAGIELTCKWTTNNAKL